MNEALEQLARKLRLDDHDNANHHQGSKSIDGCGGNWLQAADYAAYATVYGQGGYGAVADRESFEPECQWQVSCLAALAGRQ